MLLSSEDSDSDSDSELEPCLVSVCSVISDGSSPSCEFSTDTQFSVRISREEDEVDSSDEEEEDDDDDDDDEEEEEEEEEWS